MFCVRLRVVAAQNYITCHKREKIVFFCGQYHHQLDDKGRFRIPPVFRKQLGVDPMMFCSFDNCLCLYTAEAFDKLVEKRFSDTDLLDVDLADIMRSILPSVQPVVEDKQGRVSLNSAFIEQCGMSKNLISIGMFDRVEIWDEEKFKEHMNKVDHRKIAADLGPKSK